MKLFKLLASVLLTFLAATCLSAEHVKLIEIQKLHPMAEIRPAHPGTQKYTRIYFKQSAGWSSVGCRNDAADLRSVDGPLMSILLIAWSMNKAINVHVDNTLKPDGEVCQVTALTTVD